MNRRSDIALAAASLAVPAISAAAVVVVRVVVGAGRHVPSRIGN